MVVSAARLHVLEVVLDVTGPPSVVFLAKEHTRSVVGHELVLVEKSLIVNLDINEARASQLIQLNLL